MIGSGVIKRTKLEMRLTRSEQLDAFERELAAKHVKAGVGA